MASFNFYLRDISSINETPITLFIRDKSHNKIKIPTEKRIIPKYWNIKKQEVKSNYLDNFEKFNDDLKEILKITKKAYENVCAKSIPSSENIQEEIKKIKAPTISQTRSILEKNVFQHFNDFIKDSKDTDGKKYRTIQAYQSTRDHLKVFSIKKRLSIKIDGIDIKLIKTYKRYLLDEHIKNSQYDWDKKEITVPKKTEIGLTDSAISKDIKVIKTFCIWLNENGIINNKNHKVFKVEEIDADIIVLEKEELSHLSKIEVAEELQEALDLFLVGSTIGLRYSDLSTLSPHKIFINRKNLGESYLVRKTYKTNKDVQLPLLPFVAKIFLKYEEKFTTALPFIPESKFNTQIKEIGKIAGLNYLEERIRIKDGKQVKEVKEKYKYMSSHMCRRNFICLLGKAGETAETIMDLSGHKDYKSFKKYLKFFKKDRFDTIKRAIGDLY